MRILLVLLSLVVAGSGSVVAKEPSMVWDCIGVIYCQKKDGNWVRGTCTLLDLPGYPRNLALTCNHVVFNKRVQVMFKDGKENVYGTVIAQNEKYDWAVVRLDKVINIPAVKLRRLPVGVGTTVFCNGLGWR